MHKIAIPIVVVAYNRPKSLLRVLKSLDRAHYAQKNINLIISIDNKDDNQDVHTIAKRYQWRFGNKVVIYQNENLGLKKHILKCGDLSLKYGSVLVLEDDLYVSPNFYIYAQTALEFSMDKEYIGGISLYNHQLNVHTRDNFTALEDAYDNWYFQFASSWGQAWTKNQWMGFKQWHTKNKSLNKSNILPSNVINWSDKSWLKFFIVYLIEKNKYFLYPKVSFSTNFSDVGTHMGRDSTIYQVPLFFGEKSEFTFSSLESSDSTYDAFFENVNLYKSLNLTKSSLCVDLHGYKKKDLERYWLTTRILDFGIVKSFGRSLRPIEANIYENVFGNDIFLYDTTLPKKNNLKYNHSRRFTYKVKHISYNDVLRSWYWLTISKFKNILKKFS